MKARAALLLAPMLAAGCGGEERRTEAEHISFMEEIWERPEGLPPTAFVRAGLDGGQWYDCTREDEEVVCRSYGIGNGALLSEQRFRLCLMAAELSDLVGYPDSNDGGDVLNIREAAVQLRPVAPPTLYRGGGPADASLQEKVARDFTAEDLGACPIPLPLGTF